ncbi:hypothetical protein Tco_0222962 [Tanacetum coccineum]
MLNILFCFGGPSSGSRDAIPPTDSSRAGSRRVPPRAGAIGLAVLLAVLLLCDKVQKSVIVEEHSVGVYISQSLTKSCVYSLTGCFSDLLMWAINALGHYVCNPLDFFLRYHVDPHNLGADMVNTRTDAELTLAAAPPVQAAVMPCSHDSRAGRETFKELFFLQFFPRAEQERLKREYHSIRQRASENSTEYNAEIVLPGSARLGSDRQSGGSNYRNNNNNNYSRDNNRTPTKGTEVQQSHRSTNSGSQQSRIPSKGYTHPVCNTFGRRIPRESVVVPSCTIVASKCGQAGTSFRFRFRRDSAIEHWCKFVWVHSDREARRITKGRVFATYQDQAANNFMGTITEFASCFTMTPVLLDHVLCISTPMKDSARITHVYRDLPLQFDDKIRSVNALPLDMCEFDIILGYKDWLASHRAIRLTVIPVITYLTIAWAGKCFQATIHDTTSDDSSIMIRPIVSPNFRTYFPEDLQEIPSYPRC